MSTQAGAAVMDNQNMQRSAVRGPSLMQDVVFHEKIAHFDRERIPERVVHARGSGAYGHFTLTKSLKGLTTAAVLTETGKKVPVFARLSTVAGGRGSADTVRDVRGFAVKFYTDEGNWDLVGNNIPVFFIQDAMKFPDLVHSVKQEPDRGFPSAASAHDTFWDFMVHMPESTHMLMWLMSDRALPRSLRMMEGHGVHTYHLVNATGEVTCVRYRWIPRLGLQSHLWDEAVKLAGADPDYHRRELWEAIDAGQFPVWDLAVQLFTERQASSFGFDHLDATKLIPEEMVPWTVVGHMELNQNPDNFFADTEQAAFCPSRILPGMAFSNDPLLQGRLLSYLDAQMHRLGGPNFQQLPVNRPRCPVAHHLRDGSAQHDTPAGRVSYEPNSLDRKGPRALGVEHDVALSAFTAQDPLATTQPTRDRPEQFADHHTQARMFWHSQTTPEQRHIVSAFVLELSKVSEARIRERMVERLTMVDTDLGSRVAQGLGLKWTRRGTGQTPHDGSAVVISPNLSMHHANKPKLNGRCVGVLVADGSNAELIQSLVEQIEAAGSSVKVVAPVISPVTLSDGQELRPDLQLNGTSSTVFDAIAVVLSADQAAVLAQEAAAKSFVRDAYKHLKAVALDDGGRTLWTATHLDIDDFVVDAKQLKLFIKASAARLWEREDRVCPRQAQEPPLMLDVTL